MFFTRRPWCFPTRRRFPTHQCFPTHWRFRTTSKFSTRRHWHFAFDSIDDVDISDESQFEQVWERTLWSELWLQQSHALRYNSELWTKQTSLNIALTFLPFPNSSELLFFFFSFLKSFLFFLLVQHKMDLLGDYLRRLFGQRSVSSFHGSRKCLFPPCAN